METNFQKKFYEKLIILTLLFSSIFLLQLGCAKKQEVEKITVTAQKSVYCGLIYIAYDKGFWEQEGLNVKLSEFAVGRLCLEAILSGTAHMSAVSDFPLALAGLAKQDFYILATIAWGDGDVKIVARKDHGINIPLDIEGKKIATFLGTAPEFWFRKFLERYNIDIEQIKLINLRPEDMVNALIRGDIDGSVIWEPFSYHARNQLKENASVLIEKGMYDIAHNIAVKQKFALQNPELIKKLLRGLLKATEFAKNNHEEAVQIIAEATDLQAEILDSIWGNYRFGVTLEEILVEQLHSIANWAVESNIVPSGTSVPDYNKFIFIDGLRAVKISQR